MKRSPNAHHDLVLFTLPTVKGGRDWVRLFDTNLLEEDADSDALTRFRFGHKYGVTGRSRLLFALRQTRRVLHAPAQSGSGST
jgi:isoamylase